MQALNFRTLRAAERRQYSLWILERSGDDLPDGSLRLRFNQRTDALRYELVKVELHR